MQAVAAWYHEHFKHYTSHLPDRSPQDQLLDKILPFPLPRISHLARTPRHLLKFERILVHLCELPRQALHFLLRLLVKLPIPLSLAVLLQRSKAETIVRIFFIATVRSISVHQALPRVRLRYPLVALSGRCHWSFLRPTFGLGGAFLRGLRHISRWGLGGGFPPEFALGVEAELVFVLT